MFYNFSISPRFDCMCTFQLKINIFLFLAYFNSHYPSDTKQPLYFELILTYIFFLGFDDNTLFQFSVTGSITLDK